MRHLNGSKTPAHPTIISFSKQDDEQKIAVDVAMQWNDSYSESVNTFVNIIATINGGTHEEGFRAALTSVVNKVGAEKGWLKPADKKDDGKLTGDDIREGLTAVISLKITDPQFDGQTKNKLGNSNAKSFVQKVASDALTEWFIRNAAEGKAIIQKAQQAARARMAARSARDLTRRKGLLESNSMPGKLSDCQSNNPSECELYIVEGDSAGGSAKGGRNPQFQAILPIRGKILNVEKARIDRVLKNTEVQALITALGTGVHDEFDITKLRYHKIVLMADADVDGQHIRTLLLTLLFRFMRPLVEAGNVFLGQPPLFKIKWRDGNEYAYSDRERDALLETGTSDEPPFCRQERPGGALQGSRRDGRDRAVGYDHGPGEPHPQADHPGGRRRRRRPVQRADG